MDSAISLITALYWLLPVTAIISIKSRKDKNSNLKNWPGFSVLIGWASVQIIGWITFLFVPWYSEGGDTKETVVFVSIIMTVLIALHLILIRSTRVKKINELPPT